MDEHQVSINRLFTSCSFWYYPHFLFPGSSGSSSLSSSRSLSRFWFHPSYHLPVGSGYTPLLNTSLSFHSSFSFLVVHLLVSLLLPRCPHSLLLVLFSFLVAIHSPVSLYPSLSLERLWHVIKMCIRFTSLSPLFTSFPSILFPSSYLYYSILSLLFHSPSFSLYLLHLSLHRHTWTTFLRRCNKVIRIHDHVLLVKLLTSPLFIPSFDSLSSTLSLSLSSQPLFYLGLEICKCCHCFTWLDTRFALEATAKVMLEQKRKKLSLLSLSLSWMDERISIFEGKIVTTNSNLWEGLNVGTPFPSSSLFSLFLFSSHSLLFLNTSETFDFC